jgi:hypothetical protein
MGIEVVSMLRRSSAAWSSSAAPFEVGRRQVERRLAVDGFARSDARDPLLLGTSCA